MKIYYGMTVTPSKIYYSRVSNPDDFPAAKSYWFPKAEWIMKRKWGWTLIKIYLTIRCFLEKN